MLEVLINLKQPLGLPRLNLRSFVVLAMLCSAFQWSCSPTVGAKPGLIEPISEKPRNIILLIGDGMGLSQVTLASLARRNGLNMTRMPYVGFHKPYSSSNLITDSAAGATAFACGIKTFNNAIGLAMDSSKCESILETAQLHGFATGIVVTSTIVHATPAAFYAHQTTRTKYEEIAQDLLDANIDLVIGGGQKFFFQRKDDRNLMAEMTKAGVQIGSYFDQQVQQWGLRTHDPAVFFTALNSPLNASQGRDYLAYSTELATNFLYRRSPKGFVLLVEGSQIDWGGHAKNAEYTESEILDFDQAVKRALSFAQRDGETLVIVTADHETGGLALNQGDKDHTVNPTFTTNNHTGTLVPVFAYGPSAHLFSGIYENTAIHQKIMKALGWDQASKNE